MKTITKENYACLYSEPLELNDSVIFTIKNNIVFSYRVVHAWMECINNKTENIILQYLYDENLINTSIWDYCSALYGYEAHSVDTGSIWPEFDDNDFAAITRLVIDIFVKLEVAKNNPKKINLTELTNISFL